MESVLVAVVGVVGTLFGSGLTGFLSQRQARSEAIRHLAVQERQTAAAALSSAAAAILDYRSIELSRLHRVWEKRADGKDISFGDDELSTKVREARRKAWQAVFQFRTISDNASLHERLESLLEELTSLKEASSLEQAVRQSREARSELAGLLDGFRSARSGGMRGD
ncbi:hypothetical protein SAMN05216284_11888 [Micromonospora sediminimaris]|uniref:Uncharacterized protein n=1 Tax=Micromonospora sediminimaris TaxID=547162 RepID=A0A9W5XKR4_9ACTN|nr:hypothetical protein Vse01_39240 [Micromonospora sediminimaris]SFD52669.1 hypothetical protein SAMN05216284_11888 [Micromonospora sediminimaris]